MIQIIIVDDHEMFRVLLKTMFTYEYPDIVVTGEAGSGEQLFRLLEAGTPADLVLLDINLPGMWGVEAARRLRNEYPALKIIAFSGENSAESVKAMLEAGIDGFISKQQGNDDILVEAIRSVMNGLDFFGRDISCIIHDVVRTKSLMQIEPPNFSERELEVIRYCHEGLLAKQIADRMCISPNTVTTYKTRIFSKLGINNTLEMVNYALKKGIIRIQ